MTISTGESIIVYPKVTLKMAREKLREVKLLLDQNLDSSEARKEQKYSQDIDCFADVALQWWEHRRQTWSADYANRVWKRLKDNAFSELGKLAINEITPQKVIMIIKKIESRGSLCVSFDDN